MFFAIVTGEDRVVMRKLRIIVMLLGISEVFAKVDSVD